VPVDIGLGSLDVELRIGGAPVALFAVAASGGVVSARRLRAAALAAAGFELCRVVAREAIVGFAAADPRSLRDRLASRATEAEGLERRGVDGGGRECGGDAFQPFDRGIVVAASWARIAAGAGVEGDLLLARRVGAVGTSASRRATLPAAAGGALCDAARAAREPAIGAHGAPGQAAVRYVPELLWCHAQSPESRGARMGRRAPVTSGAARRDRHDFESSYAAAADPWCARGTYARRVHAETLELLAGPGQMLGRVLELGCGEGVFTAPLADRAREVIAADVSQLALDRAAARLAGRANVRLVRLDLARDALPHGMDAIVCSEVLYHLGSADARRAAAARLSAALVAGGVLVAAHSRLHDTATRPSRAHPTPTPEEIGRLLCNAPELRLESEIVTPHYHVQRFRRLGRAAREIQRLTPPGLAERLVRRRRPRSEARASESRGADALLGQEVAPGQRLTRRLPILAYGAVRPTAAAYDGTDSVSPAAFEEQLRYMADANFHGATLDEWREARARSEPLAGRAVAITFDAADADFAEHAWPLLVRYGFPALIGVDVAAVESGGLGGLGWRDLARLHAEGAEVASHGGPAALTALPMAAAVERLARARGELALALGAPPTTVVYPGGAVDPVLQHLAGACGYGFGLTFGGRPAELGDPVLALPRIRVRAHDRLGDFIRHIAR
jgi:peptidoglycan/xylan/chitin deacetylase (PgdA/CDA1 family)/SAM-dependent methyltransferase